MAQSTSKQISSQSNLKFMNEYCTLMNKKLTLVEVIQIVTLLNDFVENGYSKELQTRFQKVDELIINIKD